MRILHALTYVSADGAAGGVVAVASQQTTELAARGHRVTLAAAWDGRARLALPGVVQRLFRIRQRAPGRLVLAISLRLFRFVREECTRSDVIHIHFGRDLLSASTWMATVGTGVRVILQPHGMIGVDGRLRSRIMDALVVRRALRTATRVVCLTDKESQDLRIVGGASIALEILPNGIAFDGATIRSIPRRPVLEVLFMARLHPRKRVLTFVESARLLANRGVNADFAIVGPDEGDLAPMRAAISQAGMEGRIRYEGALPPGEGQRRLARSDVFVLPSVGEVYPMTVLESLAAGTAVVLTEDCGLAEVLRDAGAALVVPPDDPEALGKAIAQLLADSEFREEMVSRGHGLIKSTHSISSVATRLEAIYGGGPVSPVRNDRR